MSQGSFNPKIRFLGQKMWPVARTQTDRHTHTDSHTEWLLRAPFQGFRIFSFNLSSRIGPIYKDRFLSPILKIFSSKNFRVTKWYALESTKDSILCTIMKISTGAIEKINTYWIFLLFYFVHKKSEILYFFLLDFLGVWPPSPSSLPWSWLLLCRFFNNFPAELGDFWPVRTLFFLASGSETSSLWIL